MDKTFGDRQNISEQNMSARKFVCQLQKISASKHISYKMFGYKMYRLQNVLATKRISLKLLTTILNGYKIKSATKRMDIKKYHRK
jgi:hypothetical protein